MEQNFKIDVLEIKGKNSYILIKKYNDFDCIHINRKSVKELPHGSIVQFSKKDTVEYLQKSDVLVEYRNGNKVMSIETYQSKPTYYGDNTSDSEVLRRIANKKELEGYLPIYKKPDFQPVELNILGYFEDTKSDFIESSITTDSKPSVIFIISGRIVALNEWKRLKEEYEPHFKFDKDKNTSYLRFAQVNDKYVFSDYEPFGDSDYRKIFKTLEEAQEYEAKTRRAVRNCVYRIIKLEDKDKILNEFKAAQIVSRLQFIKKLSKNSMIESIDILIKDLEDFKLS